MDPIPCPASGNSSIGCRYGNPVASSAAIRLLYWHDVHTASSSPQSMKIGPWILVTGIRASSPLAGPSNGIGRPLTVHAAPLQLGNEQLTQALGTNATTPCTMFGKSAPSKSAASLPRETPYATMCADSTPPGCSTLEGRPRKFPTETLRGL